MPMYRSMVSVDTGAAPAQPSSKSMSQVPVWSRRTRVMRARKSLAGTKRMSSARFSRRPSYETGVRFKCAVVLRRSRWRRAGAPAYVVASPPLDQTRGLDP